MSDRMSGRGMSGDRVQGDPALIEAVSNHVMRWIGPITVVFHEFVSEKVHIDVRYVASTQDRPIEILVTSGMSELPMTTPNGEDVPRFAEIVPSSPRDGPSWERPPGTSGTIGRCG